MTKYKKCHDCDFFENRCYEKMGKRNDVVISICNKYPCCTDPEGTCLDHKKHNHRNYEPEYNIQASSAGRTQQTGVAPLSPPSKRDSGSRHHTKKQKGSHSVMPSGNKSGSNPSVSPYPPVRYEWEIE